MQKKKKIWSFFLSIFTLDVYDYFYFYIIFFFWSLPCGLNKKNFWGMNAKEWWRSFKNKKIKKDHSPSFFSFFLFTLSLWARTGLGLGRLAHIIQDRERKREREAWPRHHHHFSVHFSLILFALPHWVYWFAIVHYIYLLYYIVAWPPINIARSKFTHIFLLNNQNLNTTNLNSL